VDWGLRVIVTGKDVVRMIVVLGAVMSAVGRLSAMARVGSKRRGTRRNRMGHLVGVGGLSIGEMEYFKQKGRCGCEKSE
jgi:hypothetical protein